MQKSLQIWIHLKKKIQNFSWVTLKIQLNDKV